MRHLELVAAMDEWFPQWRSMVGECQREGVPLGWVAAGTGPAGTLLAEISDNEPAPEPVPLTWHARQRYLILRPSEAPEYWVRATPYYWGPVTYDVDAVLQTREVASEHDVRRWQLLTAAHEPVLLVDSLAGSCVRPWVLRADASYDLEYDIEGCWRVYGHDTPEGTVARPEP